MKFCELLSRAAIKIQKSDPSRRGQSVATELEAMQQLRLLNRNHYHLLPLMCNTILVLL